MAGIKETPTNFRVYYKSMKDAYTQKKEEAVVCLEDLRNTLNNLYETVSTDYANNRKDFLVNLDNFKEYKTNKYIDGKFLRVAKGVLINREGNYELIGRSFDVYKLAKVQKDIYDIEKDIILYDKLLALPIMKYAELLKLYYTKVHEFMILEGYGYAFEGNLGCICINRGKYAIDKRNIDYQATKERKAQLIAEGKRIYNKEEAEWCEKNGIEYDGVDCRVYQDLEYVYEVPLLYCRIPNGDAIKFTPADYRGHNIRGKSNKDILNETNGDKYKICQYDIDLKTKLNICLEADKTLYTKFIRNENQKPYAYKQNHRKSGQ